jgi:hypothetical protein
MYDPKREKKHGKTCKQIEAILHQNIATPFNVPSQPFLKKGKSKPKRGNVVKQKEKQHRVLHCLLLVTGPASTAATLLHITRKVPKQFQTVKEILRAS